MAGKVEGYTNNIVLTVDGVKEHYIRTIDLIALLYKANGDRELIHSLERQRDEALRPDR